MKKLILYFLMILSVHQMSFCSCVVAEEDYGELTDEFDEINAAAIQIKNGVLFGDSEEVEAGMQAMEKAVNELENQTLFDAAFNEVATLTEEGIELVEKALLDSLQDYITNLGAWIIANPITAGGAVLAGVSTAITSITSIIKEN